MKPLIPILLFAFTLAACSPELLPVPVTQGPTLIPETPTSAPINSHVVAAPGLVSIHMLDEQNGWGINDQQVLRTNDGGVTWYDVSPTKSTQLGYAVSADFLDAHAWVLVPDANDPLSGSLFHSSDAGLTWSTSQVPFGGGDLEFLDLKQGWMLASLGAGAGSMGVAVYQTSDGGQTWTRTYINDPNQTGAGDSLPLGGLKDGLTPVDIKTAWVGGVIYVPGEIYLYVTQDGGQTWKQSIVSTPPGYEQAELETRGPIFVDAKTAYLPVTLSSQNGVLLAMYISRDGGMSWLLTPKLIPQGGATDFVSTNDGFVWSGSDFYVTHDGAQTWTTITPDVGFGDSFGGMDFVNPTTGFVLTSDASGARALYKTTDGGATWNILSK
ncbi:MAG TPA: hypothetical protein VLU73_15440 [Methylococcaceae bacterium]|nr:hypothetical protein [Methylococcaceae bacterium]